jgi:eukaryotic-like serine/threonine-protein kinase
VVAGGEPPDDGMEQRLRRALFGGGGGEPPGPPGPTLIAGRYELLAVIGKGSMGEVHRARDIKSGTIVAVKLLRGCASVPTAAERFRREAELICRLQHANIVSILEYGDLSDGRKYIVMDLIEGTSLRTQLAKDNEVSTECACEIVRQVADALASAHQLGVVHRDLSPGNILLTQRETGLHCTVIDFGLAKCIDAAGEKLTATGDVLGTPRYMSPEQATGDKAGPASDVYALGCIAYEMLTGVPVVRGRTIAEVLDQQRHEVPAAFAAVAPHRAVPAAIEAVVLRALRKTPSERWPDMASFRDALVHARAASVAPTPEKGSRRVFALTMVLCAVAALAVAVQLA